MSLFGGIQIPRKPDLENIRKLDLLPLSQIRRMMRCGIAIDREWFWQMSSDLEAEKVELRKQITSYIPEDKLDEFVNESSDVLDFNVNSAPQMATLLFKLLGVGRGKQLKMTKSGDRLSTGKKQLETLKKDHPIIPLVLEYRECEKLKNTYTDKLPKIARLHHHGICGVCGLHHYEDHYRIHTEIVTTRTDTGRLAGRRPNLMNIPARSKRGQKVRKGFVASKGKLLVSRDFSQIELRLLAHCANESNMIRIFKEGGDIHLDTACRAFNLDYNYYSDLAVRKDKGLLKPEEKKIWADFSMQNRSPSKTTNFLIVYSGTEIGLYDTLVVNFAIAGLPCPDWLTQDWCGQFIKTWNGLYPEAANYFDLQEYRCRRYEIVWAPTGRVRRIPEVRSVHTRVQMAGLRQGGNMPIQGFAADVMKIGMARVEQRLSQLRDDNRIYAEALLPIHDELVSEVDEEWADDVGEMIGFEMENALVDEDTGVLQCRVPIATDGKSFQRWAKE